MIFLLLLQTVASEEDTRAPDSEVLRRERAFRAMGRIQSPAYIPTLLEHLDDDEAVFALGQMAFGPEWKKEDARPIIEKLLKGRATDALVLEALGKLGGPEDAIVGEMEGPHRGEAVMALFRLRHLGHIADYSGAAVSMLKKLAVDPDPEVRWRVAYAVSRWPVPALKDALVRLSTDANLWARVFAVRALGHAGGDLEALRKARNDENYQVRLEAVEAAARAKLNVEKPLRTAKAWDASPHVRAAIARTRTDNFIGDQYDESPMVRAEVAKKSGQCRDKEDHRWVLSRALLSEKFEGSRAPWLDHKDVIVASAAVESLKDPALVAQVLRDAKRPLELRGTAVEVAAELKAPELLEPLRDCYKISSTREFIEVRESIVTAAEALKATDFLEELARDPAPSVRIKAARALKRDAEPAPRPEPSPFLGVTFEKNPIVILETDRGEIEIECYADDAPVHVASFVDLVRKKTYDGLVWHRIVSNFVIQGGDPRGTGWGDAGYNLRDEINRRRYVRGTVGMPKAGKDTGGCQIFITHTPTPHLDGRYTVFGQVTRGLDVVDAIEPLDRIVRARVKE